MESQVAALSVVTSEQLVNQCLQVWSLESDTSVDTYLLATSATDAVLNDVLETSILELKSSCRALSYAGTAKIVAALGWVESPANLS